MTTDCKSDITLSDHEIWYGSSVFGTKINLPDLGWTLISIVSDSALVNSSWKLFTPQTENTCYTDNLLRPHDGNKSRCKRVINSVKSLHYTRIAMKFQWRCVNALHDRLSVLWARWNLQVHSVLRFHNNTDLLLDFEIWVQCNAVTVRHKTGTKRQAVLDSKFQTTKRCWMSSAGWRFCFSWIPH